MTKKKEEYVGMRFTSNKGEEFEVVKYINSAAIVIRFDSNGYEKTITMPQARTGSVRNDEKVEKEKIDAKLLKIREKQEKEALQDRLKSYESECIAKMTFNPVSISEPELKFPPSEYHSYYTRWRGVIDRCNPVKQIGRDACYKGCSISEEWKDFQNFAQWCEDNNLCGGMDIDKDVLIKGNKVYSSETCLVIPSEINTRAGFNKPLRKELMGTQKVATKNGFRYRARFGGGSTAKKELGTFDTELEAHKAWANYKKSILEPLIEQYKYAMTDRAYKALKDYSFLHV